jgi:hypothetical protein
MIAPWETMQSILINHAVTILLLIGWLLITSGMGRLLLGWTAIRFVSRGEAFFFSLGIGLVVTAYSFFILGITQSLYPGLIIALLILLALLAIIAGDILSVFARSRRTYGRSGTLQRHGCSRLSFLQDSSSF